MFSFARFSLRAMLMAAVGVTTLSAPAFADPPWKQGRDRDWSYGYERGPRGWDGGHGVRRGPPTPMPPPYVVLERERYIYVEPRPARIYVPPPPRPDVTIVVPLSFN